MGKNKRKDSLIDDLKVPEKIELTDEEIKKMDEEMKKYGII